MRKHHLAFWISALGLPLLALTMHAGTAAPEGPLKLTSITPSGVEVPPGRQIVLQFDRKVVPVGRMERSAEEIPIAITPALDCEWRWLNTSALACQLGENDALKPATEYRVVVSSGIEAEDGTGLAEPVEHVFVTERPAATGVRFDQWLGPGTPRLRVHFNQRVTEESVEAHLAFRAAGDERVRGDRRARAILGAPARGAAPARRDDRARRRARAFVARRPSALGRIPDGRRRHDVSRA